MWRCRPLLDSASKHSCQAWGCGADDGTIVAAHSNAGVHGKGLGIKAHDWAVCALCSVCHAYVDSSQASQADRTAVWWGAFVRSVPLFRRFYDDEATAAVQAAMQGG